MITGINGYGASQYAYAAKNAAVDEQAGKTSAVKTQDDKAQKVDAAQEEKAAGAAQSTETVTAKAADVKVQDDSGDKAGKAPVKTDIKGVMDSFRGGRELNIFSSTSRFNEIDDAEKALKSMKKDDVLDRYTYFVNPTATGLGTDADGTVRLKSAN